MNKNSEDRVMMHLYEFSKVLRPRGSMEKESMGTYIFEKLMSAYESWTHPLYGDNPDETTLKKLLQQNLIEEVEAAWAEFSKFLNLKGQENE